MYQKSYTTDTIHDRKKRLRYKGVPVTMFGLLDFRDHEKEKIENHRTTKRQYLRSFISDFKEDLPKNLLVIYDIPYEKKVERDWFRRQLRKFDFVMIQKSVWVAPSPLPAEFLAYLKRIGLQKGLKTFKLEKAYADIL
jgi:hypothetical protein